MTLLHLENGVEGGGAAPGVPGVGEPLRFPGGSEARPPVGGRPGGLAAPALWGLPLPARRVGFPPGRGHIPHGLLTKAWAERGRLVGSSWRYCEREVAAGGAWRASGPSSPGGLPFPRPVAHRASGEGD